MERKKNVAEIKRLIQERKQNEGAYASLTRFLIAKGISRTLSEEITLVFAEEKKELSSLKQILAAYVKTTGEMNLSQPKRLALIGPTGVGKTTTLVKLALHFSQQKNKRVALLTLDKQKKGARAQLEHAAGIAVFEDLPKAGEYDLVLIDTPGCNFYQNHRIDELGELLANYPDIEMVLTLSAAAKEIDLYGAIHQFSPLQPKSLIFTKLDETLSSGVLLNIAAKSDLPIRYIAYGYPLPGEIQLADPYNITHKILTDFNEEEFQVLRQLSV